MNEPAPAGFGFAASVPKGSEFQVHIAVLSLGRVTWRGVLRCVDAELHLRPCWERTAMRTFGPMRSASPMRRLSTSVPVRPC